MPPTGGGNRIRLRDVTVADADRFDELVRLEQAGGGFNDFGLQPPRVDRETLARTVLRNEQNGVFLVERLADAAVIGTIGFRRVQHGPNAESAGWMIGLELVAEARGRGYGAEAQRLMADWLFEHSRANRVEAATDVDNLAEQRSLEKAGFVRDGVLRGAQFRAGRFHDLVVYSRLRGDPRARP
jgi:RimJ/RimL family protein N-acetyltransferase